MEFTVHATEGKARHVTDLPFVIGRLSSNQTGAAASAIQAVQDAQSAAAADAFDLEESLRQLHAQHRQAWQPDLHVTQDGMTLDQAIESVRRRGDVDRILSAETRRDGDREMHHIRYLTKDGKVRTAKIRGRSR